MARFILDIATDNSKEQAEQIMHDIENGIINSGMITVTCIDVTNNNQFFNEHKKNKLSKEQISNYNQLTF